MGEFDPGRTFMGGLLPNSQQTDVAHMVDFAHSGLPFNSMRNDSSKPINQDKKIEDIPECTSGNKSFELECRAKHYFGSWFDSFANLQKTIFKPLHDFFIDAAEETSYPKHPKSNLESLMICPPPNMLSTGAHRVVTVFWMSGERYAMVFEEGGSIFDPTGENIFVEGLTPAARSNVLDPDFIENKLVPSIVLAMTGHELYPPAHKFAIDVFDPARPPVDPSHTGHWFEGCRPSKLMYRY